MRHRAVAVACVGLFVVAILAADASPQTRSAPPTRKERLFAPRDLGLLETPDREEWQKTDLIMDELQIADGSRVADLGTGGGWFSIRLARRVGPNGLVYAQDIQPMMIEATSRRVLREGLRNVRPILGTASDPRLPQNEALDAVLIVGAFDEMDDPARPDAVLTLLGHVARSLKPAGRLGVVEFLPGAGGPGPAPDERVDPETVIRTAAKARFKLQKHEEIPPFMFLLVFGRDPGAPAAR